MAKAVKKVVKIKAAKKIIKSSPGSPFKDVKELRKEIVSFLNLHRSRIQNQAKRISDYFEMCCFNYVVRFYEGHDYVVTIKNLQGGKYRYKCSTQGNQINFSFFEVSFAKESHNYIFEIHHNLAIESFHEENIYTTPDISVVKYSSIKINENFYEGNKKLSYVDNGDLITFCEVKQFNPFPELIFNFIGTLNELKKEILQNDFEKVEPGHIAPSLMISGKPNSHAERIKKSLESRYCINIIYDLFSSGSAQFSRAQVNRLKKIE